MANIRILRKNDKAYIELPQDMAGSDEVELFHLRDGYYMLTAPLGAPKRESGTISEREKGVLRKLLSIRFENRTPEYVKKTLSGEELAVLNGLEERKLVNVFIGRKYKDGVYNISDKIYPLLSGKAGAAANEEEPERRVRAAASPATAVLSLRSQGFVVLPNKREAMTLSELLGDEMKKGGVIGVKGFDGRFYAVTRSYFESSQSSINSVLKEDMDSPSISQAAKLDPEGCMAVLRLMAENGDILEKKKGVFAPV
ncbi:MAG: hypothetical protein AB1295_05990 [Candidatus Micrarchaeota archaeon]